MSQTRTAIAGVQKILSVVTGKRLIADGVVGPKTLDALGRAPSYALRALGDYAQSKGFVFADLMKPIVKAVSGRSGGWAEKLFPVLVKTAKANGLLPVAVVSQVILESGWDPKPIGGTSFNFGGIKANSIRGYKSNMSSISSKTKESVNGKMISITDSFAVFDSVEDYANGYVWYILHSPSSRNYRGIEKATTVEEYGKILQDTSNGKLAYATDPKYVEKLVSVARRIEKSYSHWLR